jgi:DNA mismatch repair protein MutL
MSKIKVLDEVLINKIAAGEVIERPASVVKELIENSIDAKAKKIFISVKEGGKSFIRVTDDGVGMDKDDVTLSILRHATSKIADIDDLFNIHSLGFRGEALASIASISNTNIKTNNGESEGVSLEIKGGEIISNESIAIPRGTTVIVKNLFYNVPVRKKHLKKMETELRTIVDIVMRYALIHYDIYFELLHNDKIILNSPGTTSIRNNIANLYGSGVAKNVLPVNYSNDDITIKGEISKPGFQRNDKKYQSLFINGRYIKNKIINDAVYTGFHTFLNINKHPIYFLDIKLSPKKIDVNVHPTKSQIRIEKENEVYDAVVKAIRETISGGHETDRVSKIKFSEMDLKLDSYQLKKDKQTSFEEIVDFVDDSAVEDETDKKEKGDGTGEFIEMNSVEKSENKKSSLKHDFRILGQIIKTYVIVSIKGGMIIVDQHAAQERVKYEKYLRQYKDQEVVTQKLLEPLMIELSIEEGILFEGNKEIIANLGFGIEEFGKHTYLLRKVPTIFNRIQSRDIFLTIIDELRSGKTKKLDEIKEERIIRMACRSSIKANEHLEYHELVKVIEELFSSDQPLTCPHGRPTMLKFTVDDFEKMFRRKGL